MRGFGRIKQWLSAEVSRREYAQIYRRFQQHTMVPRDWFYANLSLSESVRQLPGTVVECGVWRGGMSAALATLLGPEREYYLFDSFEGLPPAQAIDGESALAWQSDSQGHNYFNNCTASQADAEAAMKMTGVPHYSIIKGWFSETLHHYSAQKPIALLRLDGDWYESTMSCLTAFYDKVASGGLIIIDDYLSWDGCAKAVHDFLSGRQAAERIRTKEGFAYLIKV